MIVYTLMLCLGITVVIFLIVGLIILFVES